MSTRKSLVFSFLDRYSGLAITVVSSMVIARLLTPAEIGVYSVTMVLMMFASTVRDMGAGQYLVQEKDLTTDRIRAVWTIQLGLGLGLACLVVIASYPVAVFYEEPRMRGIMYVIALNYAVNPFGSLTHAWLMREMRFDSSALIRLSGNLGGATVAMWMAWKDFGPISLAWGSLTTSIIGAAMAVYFRPSTFPWLPGVREIKRVLAFGSQLTASSIISVVASGAPELLLGKLQNLTATGLYSRSSGLVQMFHRLFVEAVGAVCLPWFARQSREQRGVVPSFLQATAYITAFGWSFCFVVVCLAHPIMRVLYGDQWDGAVDLARLLAVAMAFSVPSALCHTVLLSSGAVKTIVKVSVLVALESVAFVAVGAYFGLTELGWALIASAVVTSAIWLQATAIHIGLPFKLLVGSFGKSALVAILSGVGPVLALMLYGPYPSQLLAPLVLGGTVALLGFVLGIAVFRHPVLEEFTIAWNKLKAQFA